MFLTINQNLLLLHLAIILTSHIIPHDVSEVAARVPN